jgi:hypothetical protein
MQELQSVANDPVHPPEHFGSQSPENSSLYPQWSPVHPWSQTHTPSELGEEWITQ